MKIIIHYSGSYIDMKLEFKSEAKAMQSLKSFKKEHQKKLGSEKLIVNIKTEK